MSLKLSKRLSSKKKKLPVDNVHNEVLFKLGLEAYRTKPLDLAAMLGICTWSVENQPLQIPIHLPRAFLQRLWLLNPQARSTYCQPSPKAPNSPLGEEPLNGLGFEESSLCALNPLDLVTAVYRSANAFLQQEMTSRMRQCNFAIPVLLPPLGPEEQSCFLLWSLRGALGSWSDASMGLQEGDLATTSMPLVSFVKLGKIAVSKSRVLNRLVSGPDPRRQAKSFLHRHADGGQLPRRLANGLVEMCWLLPSPGHPGKKAFPEPVGVANLRGNAAEHEKEVSFLCGASSALVVFCGELREKEKNLLASWKRAARQLLLIDLSDLPGPEAETRENRVVGFTTPKLGEELNLPEGALLSGCVSEDDIADRLTGTLNKLLPGRIKPVTLEAAEAVAEVLGLSVDEEPVCKKALAQVEEVLRGLEEEGSVGFRQQHLALQGEVWQKLADMEKEEAKQRASAEGVSLQLQIDKQLLQDELKSYRMPVAMRVFTEALCTTDTLERGYFLRWMRSQLGAKQRGPAYKEVERSAGCAEDTDDYFDDSFETDSSLEEARREETVISQSLQKPTSDVETNEPTKQDHDKKYLEPAVKADQSENGCLGFVISAEIHRTDQILSSEPRPMDGEQSKVVPKHSQAKNAEPVELDPSVQLQLRAIHHCEQTALEEEQVTFDLPPPDPRPPFLRLEHFLREMGLVFELTHGGQGGGDPNVPRLPGVAADLLLHGIPLELLDGDASAVPSRWLDCVLSTLKRRLVPDEVRVRVLTTMGAHCARNAGVFSALFGIDFPGIGGCGGCGGGEVVGSSTRGIYLQALSLPAHLKKDMECDLLFILDVEGLGCTGSAGEQGDARVVRDDEVATLATGLSDVVVQNIAPDDGEHQSSLVIMVNALLRAAGFGGVPVCLFLTQGEGPDAQLQASRLRRVAEVLRTGTEEEQPSETTAAGVNRSSCVIQPWPNSSVCEPMEDNHSEAVLEVKKSLFDALTRCSTESKATGLSEFTGRLIAVWEAVKGGAFTVGLGDSVVAEAFCTTCTELCQWEDELREHMESWVTRATVERILSCKAKALETGVEGDPLSTLKDEARSEVKAEADLMRSKLEAHLAKDGLHGTCMETYRAHFERSVDKLRDRVTKETMDRLESAKENHYSTSQLQSFQSTVEERQRAALCTLTKNSRLSGNLLQDQQLEKEFDGLWNDALSAFDFRPSEKEDITERVREILRANLVSRGLEKHMQKLEDFGKERKTSFVVYDDYFGYRSRMKHMFEDHVVDNNTQQRLEAHRLSSQVLEECIELVAEKKTLLADFSDSYITEMLVKVEKSLRAKPLDIRSAFEVDLKVHLCCNMCQDFQEIHDRYAKDRDLLVYLHGTKERHQAEFIYQFRKRDQCQRVARSFTTMVLRPTALDYIYRPQGQSLAEGLVTGKEAQHYLSPRAFHHDLLEQLLEQDTFQGFLDYLPSYDGFIQRKVQEKVESQFLTLAILEEWRQRRLGEIVGKMAAVVSQTSKDTPGVLSDTELLLEKVCLTLEKEVGVKVSREPLESPLFHITTEWDRFDTCLLEGLAELRLELAQEFSQNRDVTQLLQGLQVQLRDFLLSQVRGCGTPCPFCCAPCEVSETGHKVHRARFHRPQGVLSYTRHGSGSPSHSSCPLDSAPNNLVLNGDVTGDSRPYVDHHSLYPDWSTGPGGVEDQTPSAYWRYVLVRFNDSFAEEFHQTAAQLPGDWEKITKEEALESVTAAFQTPTTLTDLQG